MTDKIREHIAYLTNPCRLQHSIEAGIAMEAMLAENEILSKRVDWTVADNVKKAIALDNIKVRAYELGQKELHDMALAALDET